MYSIPMKSAVLVLVCAFVAIEALNCFSGGVITEYWSKDGVPSKISKPVKTECESEYCVWTESRYAYETLKNFTKLMSCDVDNDCYDEVCQPQKEDQRPNGHTNVTTCCCKGDLCNHPNKAKNNFKQFTFTKL